MTISENVKYLSAISTLSIVLTILFAGLCTLTSGPDAINHPTFLSIAFGGLSLTSLGFGIAGVIIKINEITKNAW